MKGGFRKYNVRDKGGLGARASFPGTLMPLLDFRNGDGLRLTDLDTAFAAETFLSIYGLGFSVLHLKNVHGTDFDTFLAALTFLFVDNDVITHLLNPPG
jgi:hypothetical protein